MNVTSSERRERTTTTLLHRNLQLETFLQLMQSGELQGEEGGQGGRVSKVRV